MKKILFGIVSILMFVSVSYWAKLYFLPAAWEMDLCEWEFTIALDLDYWDNVVTADLVLDSDMKFLSFEKTDLFRYASEPYQDWNLIRITLFNDFGVNLLEWWIVWTVKYKVINNEQPYLKFQFLWTWITSDTNVSFEWNDLLTRIWWWNYLLLWGFDCIDDSENVMDIEKYDESMNKLINTFEENHKRERLQIFWQNSKWYFLWLLLLLVIIILVIDRLKKKWTKN